MLILTVQFSQSETFFAVSKSIGPGWKDRSISSHIKRKAGVSDTGLSNLKDVRGMVLYVLLTGDGVFGKGLEENLKKGKE